MSENANEILAEARRREAAREAAYVPIDYQAANREFRQQKAALTRAVNSGDRDKVVRACAKAVREWNQPGRAWPDDWSRWQRALDDVFPGFTAPRLEDLA
jgi:hypothetical protein